MNLVWLPASSNGAVTSHELFDQETRRQYEKRLPQRNPFGTEENPVGFNDFDIFTKVWGRQTYMVSKFC